MSPSSINYTCQTPLYLCKWMMAEWLVDVARLIGSVPPVVGTPYLEYDEMACKATGTMPPGGFEPELLRRWTIMRGIWAKPISVNSMYRSPEHPIEKTKAEPGIHAQGRAMDIGYPADPVRHSFVGLVAAVWRDMTVLLADGHIHLDTRPGIIRRHP